MSRWWRGSHTDEPRWTLSITSWRSKGITAAPAITRIYCRSATPWQQTSCQDLEETLLILGKTQADPPSPSWGLHTARQWLTPVLSSVWFHTRFLSVRGMWLILCLSGISNIKRKNESINTGWEPASEIRTTASLLTQHTSCFHILTPWKSLHWKDVLGKGSMIKGDLPEERSFLKSISPLSHRLLTTSPSDCPQFISIRFSNLPFPLCPCSPTMGPSTFFFLHFCTLTTRLLCRAGLTWYGLVQINRAGCKHWFIEGKLPLWDPHFHLQAVTLILTSACAFLSTNTHLNKCKHSLKGTEIRNKLKQLHFTVCKKYPKKTRVSITSPPFNFLLWPILQNTVFLPCLLKGNFATHTSMKQLPNWWCSEESHSSLVYSHCYVNTITLKVTEAQEVEKQWKTSQPYVPAWITML